MKKNYSRGFTLIELLVVIAIIGILASVVLASLNSARNKGADAATKSAMANMRAQAEIFYDNSSAKAYNTDGATAISACSGGMFSDTQIAAMLSQITAQSKGPVHCGTSADGQQWGVDTTLKTGTTWCVDNSGWAKAGAETGGVCS